MSDQSQGPGWWQASDGKWYPPEQAPGGGAQQAGAGGGAQATGPGGQPLAEWGQRALAWLLDYVIVLGVFIVLYIVMIIGYLIADILGVLLYLVTLAASFGVYLYWGYLVGQKGQSPGMAIMGLKCVNQETGQSLGGGTGVVRALAQIVNSIICYVGWFFPLWDERKQTVGDKIMSTVVLADEPKKSFSIDLFKP